jgi:hypothetical protein
VEWLPRLAPELDVGDAHERVDAPPVQAAEAAKRTGARLRGAAPVLPFS